MKIVCVELNLVRGSRFFAVFGMKRLKFILIFMLMVCSLAQRYGCRGQWIQSTGINRVRSGFRWIRFVWRAFCIGRLCKIVCRYSLDGRCDLEFDPWPKRWAIGYSCRWYSWRGTVSSFSGKIDFLTRTTREAFTNHSVKPDRGTEPELAPQA